MKDLNEIWSIYCDSFPQDERRNKNQQMIILNNNKYKLNGIYNNKKVVGFHAVWSLDNFTFIEHIAINKNYKGKGYGSKAIKDIIKKFGNKTILEVEKPETVEAIKRINFYIKLGFHLNNYDYKQPAYDKEKNSVSLLIMSYPNKLTIKEFEKIRDELYSVVYKSEA